MSVLLISVCRLFQSEKIAVCKMPDAAAKTLLNKAKRNVCETNSRGRRLVNLPTFDKSNIPFFLFLKTTKKPKLASPLFHLSIHHHNKLDLIPSAEMKTVCE